VTAVPWSWFTCQSALGSRAGEGDPMAELPSGTVTFLFTDLEGSTRLWEEHPEAMQPALARHDEILRGHVEAHGGAVVKTTGDGLHAAFATAEDAVAAAVAMQVDLATGDFETVGVLRVRMGLHTGAADLRDGDYYGSAVNRAARIMSAAHGGQIAVSHATEELLGESLPDGFEFVDLGEHRLRDLSRAERVFQLCAPALAREFPPLRSLDSFPGNLPLQLTSFVGREQDLHEIAKTFDTTRLVTLTGVGGVGKTRLAMQVAAEVLPRFPDGAWFCELAAASDDEAMAQVVATTLGVNPRAGVTLSGSVIEFLGGKRLLLVLDNCEHLLSAAARLAEGILRGCPEVCVLATSREGLGTEGERNWSLRSLAVPDSSDATGVIEATDAVRLFVERATDAHADFVLDASGATSVAEICRRLDGIPLAIELAAARTVAMSPREIAARLDERFRLLTGGRRTAVERHQTLRATVDWSYSMLDERVQIVFDRLGVFAGSFDADAAEAIAAGDGIESWDVLDAVTDLVAKSMVVTERSADGTRYQLLETMRAYARERLDADAEGDRWRRAHAEYYAGFAGQAGPGMVSADEFVWRPRVREELDNLRAAVNWSLDSGTEGDSQYAIRIIAALAYLANQDRPSGVGAWAERAIDVAEVAEPAFRAPILAAAAESARGRGETEVAHGLAVEALRDGIPAESPETVLAYVVLSVTDATLGNPELAYEDSRAGIAAAEASVGSDTFATPVMQCVATIWATFLGDADGALRLAESSLQTARRVGNPTLLTVALYSFGGLLELDDPSRAAECFDEVITLVDAGAATTVYSPALGASAVLCARAGDPEVALQRLRLGIDRSHYEADIGFLVGAVVSATIVFESLGSRLIAACLAGVATLGPYAPFNIGIAALRVGLPDVIVRLRTELGTPAFEAAAARGAEMTPDEIHAFVMASIDEALEELHHDA
jgi:predicted ATPase/class 3 adenylate cyclase